ncbi:MAG: MBL fold metallo-hydrolase [Treponema sp.]|jgi:L-ascorbate 6-phosphate lactonase|nr:MBL fold metallo-hydrolase [Treponema sp.]
MTATLTWYGQGIFLVKTATHSLLIDPYFSDSCAEEGFIRRYPPPVQKGELRVDSVASTHPHGDHLDLATLRDYIAFETFYGPSSCVDALKAEGFPQTKLRRLDRGDRADAGGLRLNAVYACHTQDSIGVVVECEGTKIYFSGDTLMDEKLIAANELGPDILAICINGKFGNMSWQEAVVLAHRLRVKTAIPAHYDLFAINAEDPAPFAAAFTNSPIRCRIMERGQPCEIAALL